MQQDGPCWTASQHPVTPIPEELDWPLLQSRRKKDGLSTLYKSGLVCWRLTLNLLQQQGTRRWGVARPTHAPLMFPTTGPCTDNRPSASTPSLSGIASLKLLPQPCPCPSLTPEPPVNTSVTPLCVVAVHFVLGLPAVLKVQLSRDRGCCAGRGYTSDSTMLARLA